MMNARTYCIFDSSFCVASLHTPILETNINRILVAHSDRLLVANDSGLLVGSGVWLGTW